MPIFERFEAGPEADLIVPCRVVRVRPPGEMQETWQRLQVMPHAREDQLELLVIARSPEPNPLHALIDCHGRSPDSGLDVIYAAPWSHFIRKLHAAESRLPTPPHTITPYCPAPVSC